MFNVNGIIPARAGFTTLRLLPHSAPQDHPRSRGVYTTIRSRLEEFTGSSPLARGLLSPGGFRLEAGGIIPARAGFTFPLGA